RARTIEVSLATSGIVQTPHLLGKTNREWELSCANPHPLPALTATERKYPEWLTAAWKTRNSLFADGKSKHVPGAFDQLDRVLLQAERQWRLGDEPERIERDFELANHYLNKQLEEYDALRSSYPNVSLSDYREQGLQTPPQISTEVAAYFSSADDLESLPEAQRIAGLKKLQSEVQAKLKTATRIEVALAIDEQLRQLAKFDPTKFAAASELLELWETHPRQLEEAYWLWLARLQPDDPNALQFYNCVTQQQEIVARLEPFPWVVTALSAADQRLHAAKMGLVSQGFLPQTWNGRQLYAVQPQLDRLAQRSKQLATAYDVTRRAYRLNWLIAERAITEPDSSVTLRTAMEQTKYLMSQFTLETAKKTSTDRQSEVAALDQATEISTQLGKTLEKLSQVPADSEIHQWIANLSSPQPTASVYLQADQLLRAPWVAAPTRATLCAALRKASFTLTVNRLNRPPLPARDIELEANAHSHGRIACYLHGFYYSKTPTDETTSRDFPNNESTPNHSLQRWQTLLQMQADYRLLQSKVMRVDQNDDLFESVERRLALVATCPIFQLSNSISQVEARDGRTSIEVDYRVITPDAKNKTPQIGIISPSSCLTASIVSEVPNRAATIVVQATPEATPSQLASVKGVTMTWQTSWGTIYRRVPLPPMFDHELELLAAATLDGPRTALSEIDLRPIKGRQSQYWFLRNVTDKALKINLKIAAGQTYQQKMEIPPRGVAPIVIAGKPIAPPAPLPSPPANVSLDATDETSGKSLLHQELPVRVLTPRSYVQVTDMRCEYRPGGARITAMLSAADFPSGPPSNATLEFTPDEFPSLVNIVGGVLTSSLS
ncbi:MAG: hypothetical protein ACIALR_09725, partial [Blastopirellula sp. JB062]